MDAIRAADRPALVKILGPESRDIVASGDDVADRQAFRRFVERYEQAHRLEAGDGRVVLYVGGEEFPLPIPLVPDAEGWRFDTAAGREEILSRRVGQNELAAIQVCLAYVDAQREYYVLGANGAGLLEYAQRLISTAGKRDGLYWPSKLGEPPSPLGALVARARSEGRGRSAKGQPAPYHGYFYRVLAAQGADAPGGAYNYIVRGQMIGGFGLVAYPAQHGNSGVMTFIMNQDGTVYQKDLGAATARTTDAMKVFNLGPGWQPAEPGTARK